MTAQDLIGSFRAEVSEQLDELAQALEALPSANGPEREELLLGARRLAHNIKGISATVGLEALTSITHAFESVLRRLTRDSEKAAKPPTGLLLRAVTLMQRLSEGDCEPVDCIAILERLRDHCQEEDRTVVDSALQGLAALAPGTSNGPALGSGESDEAARGTERRDGKSSIRVDTHRLDRVMGYVGEMLVTHARMAARNEEVEQIYHTFHEVFQTLSGSARTNLAPVVAHLERMVQNDRKELLGFGNLSQELSTAMKQVRMMPLASLAPAWRRLVREAAQELGKLVDLHIEVGEIELDRFVLERLSDPMIHLLRNAVAHGIETGEERVIEGKRPAGQIAIRAGMQGAMVEIDISDDGRGVDSERVGQAAVRRGLLTQEQLANCTPKQVVGLIFESGFSTTERADRISGRGVGLDVVRQHLEELHGSVSVLETPRLGGTTFRLTVPISVLSSKGLLVRACNTTYALPIEHVMSSIRIRRTQIRSVEGAQVFQEGVDEPLPVRSLAELMQPNGEWRKQESQSNRLKVVALASGKRRLGVVVDDVLRDAEFVVKKLPWNLKRVPGVNGAVVLPDGSLAVAVDVAWLFLTESGHPDPANSKPARAAVKPSRMKAKLRILLVDDSVTSRALERNVLCAAGHEVSLAVNGADAWKILQEQKFDIVVSDVMMPEMNGFELTTRIRKSVELKELPVILVTNLSRDEDLAAGAAAGANEYLVKGKFEQDKLVEAVAKYA